VRAVGSAACWRKRRWPRAIGESGRIDVLVNNAGHGLVGALEELSEGQFRSVLETNLFGAAAVGIRVTIVEPGPFRTDFAGRSMVYSRPIDDYAGTPAGALRARFAAQDGKQPNDPARAAAAIIRAVRDENAPLRLPLGPEAVTRIRDKLTAQLADLERWEAISVDTRFP